MHVDCLAAPAGANGVSLVSFTKAAGGDTLYLSYCLFKGRDVMADTFRLVGYGQIFPGSYNRTL